MLDLQPVGGAIRLQGHRNGVLRGEDASLLLTYGHVERLLHQGRRRRQELHRKSVDQHRIALSRKADLSELSYRVSRRINPPEPGSSAKTSRSRVLIGST